LSSFFPGIFFSQSNKFSFFYGWKNSKKLFVLFQLQHEKYFLINLFMRNIYILVVRCLATQWVRAVFKIYCELTFLRLNGAKRQQNVLAANAFIFFSVSYFNKDKTNGISLSRMLRLSWVMWIEDIVRHLWKSFPYSAWKIAIFLAPFEMIHF
jgi:hypothetical protein